MCKKIKELLFRRHFKKCVKKQIKKGQKSMPCGGRKKRK